MDRIALVTGANRGIGKEVVRQLAAAGDVAILGSRDLAKGEAAADEIGDAGHVEVVQLDVVNGGSVEAAAETIGERHGRLDVLVNNAAVDYDTDAGATTIDIDRAFRNLDTNLLGPWRVVQAMLPLLRESPHGRIVNVSSGAGSLAGMGAGAPSYSIAKAGVNALTRILAAELRDEGILVNAVCPGWVRTDMGGSNADRSVDEGAASIMWAVDLTDDGPTGTFTRDGVEQQW